jgi:hypothetical protein
VYVLAVLMNSDSVMTITLKMETDVTRTVNLKKISSVLPMAALKLNAWTIRSTMNSITSARTAMNPAQSAQSHTKKHPVLNVQTKESLKMENVPRLQPMLSISWAVLR